MLRNTKQFIRKNFSTSSRTSLCIVQKRGGGGRVLCIFQRQRHYHHHHRGNIHHRHRRRRRRSLDESHDTACAYKRFHGSSWARLGRRSNACNSHEWKIPQKLRMATTIICSSLVSLASRSHPIFPYSYSSNRSLLSCSNTLCLASPRLPCLTPLSNPRSVHDPFLISSSLSLALSSPSPPRRLSRVSVILRLLFYHPPLPLPPPNRPPRGPPPISFLFPSPQPLFCSLLVPHSFPTTSFVRLFIHLAVWYYTPGHTLAFPHAASGEGGGHPSWRTPRFEPRPIVAHRTPPVRQPSPLAHADFASSPPRHLHRVFHGYAATARLHFAGWLRGHRLADRERKRNGKKRNRTGYAGREPWYRENRGEGIKGAGEKRERERERKAKRSRRRRSVGGGRRGCWNLGGFIWTILLPSPYHERCSYYAYIGISFVSFLSFFFYFPSLFVFFLLSSFLPFFLSSCREI